MLTVIKKKLSINQLLWADLTQPVILKDIMAVEKPNTQTFG